MCLELQSNTRQSSWAWPAATIEALQNYSTNTEPTWRYFGLELPRSQRRLCFGHRRPILIFNVCSVGGSALVVAIVELMNDWDLIVLVPSIATTIVGLLFAAFLVGMPITDSRGRTQGVPELTKCLQR